MLILPWLLLFVGAALLWLPGRFRYTACLFLASGYGAAALDGRLGLPALAPLALLAISAILIQRKGWSECAGFSVFVITSIGLALHRVPGFENLEAVAADVLSSGSDPANLWLNLDKPLVGFWVMLFLPWHLGTSINNRPLIQTALILGGTVTACLGLAFVTSSVTWAPKWPEWGWLWALNNLLLVCMAEEAFFRSFVQGGLERLLGNWRHGRTLALAVAALLFGLAHHRGGISWMCLATIAGIGYGLAWRAGGLRAATATHFSLNLIHFVFFTYPMLSRTG